MPSFPWMVTSSSLRESQRTIGGGDTSTAEGHARPTAHVAEVSGRLVPVARSMAFKNLLEWTTTAPILCRPELRTCSFHTWWRRFCERLVEPMHTGSRLRILPAAGGSEVHVI